MDIKHLIEAFAEHVVVKHGGHTFHLHAPKLEPAVAVVARFAKAAQALGDDADGRAVYLGALAEAIELTLDVKDGDLPEGIGQRILLGTGGIASPVGQAAARLVGLHQISGDTEPDDLPT